MAEISWKGRVEERLARSGQTLGSLTPATGLDFMLDLFREHPEVGDLDWTWGRVTRYGPDEDGFQIRCWFHGTDPVAPALTLAFKVGPADVAGDFPDWGAECSRPDEAGAFRASIVASPAFQRWGRTRVAAVSLHQNEARDPRPLFDCWGVRDPARRIVSMTAEEWACSDDAGLMLRWFRQEWPGAEADLNRLLRRYCLACARRIWPLLPLAESREGIEVAERHLHGKATDEERSRAEWYAEGAAFAFETPSDAHYYRPEIDEATQAVARMPEAHLAGLLHRPQPEDDLTPRGILAHAAYFADHAMCYPLHPAESIERYSLFLSAPLLREMVGTPPAFAARTDPDQ